MTAKQSIAVDRYIAERLVASDAVLASAARAQLPAINVAPNQGKLFMLLAQLGGARRILEVGTLAGYSAIWLARALPPSGRLITLESDPTHAEIARANFVRAGLAQIIELRLGPALQTLPVLEEQRQGPFDLIFIDADKHHCAEYFEWAVKLSRRGGLIVDNVVRDGAVVDPANHSPEVIGIRRLYDALARDPRVSATAIQTIGLKGHDGVAIALVIAG